MDDIGKTASGLPKVLVEASSIAYTENVNQPLGVRSYNIPNSLPHAEVSGLLVEYIGAIYAVEQPRHTYNWGISPLFQQILRTLEVVEERAPGVRSAVRA